MKYHCFFEQSGTFKKGENKTVKRSMMHPQYANRFIRQQILEEI